MEHILDGCLSADASVRNQAEERLKSLEADMPALVSSLMAVVTTPGPDSRRDLAAVLLRGRLDARRGSVFVNLQAPLQQQVKAALLATLASEQSTVLCKKICHVVGQVASACADEGFRGWPEVLPAVFQLAQAGNEAKRELALYLFKQLVQYVGSMGVSPHVTSLQPVLGQLLKDPSARVATAALQGIAAVIAELEQEADRRHFLVLMPGVLHALERALSPGGDEGAAQDALRSLTEVVEKAPSFMRDFLEPSARAMLAIIQHDQFEDDTRTLGLEFLVCLAECAGGSVRKFPALVENVLALATRLITQAEDDDDWVRQDNALGGGNTYFADGDEEDEDELVKAGTEAIDRLATAIGGKIMVPTLQSTLAPMLVSPEWKARRASLITMALALQACVKQLAPAAGQLVAQFLPFLRDPHPRVRFAAIRFFEQLAEDYVNPNGDDEEVEGNADLASAVVTSGKGGAARAAKAKQIPGLWKTAGATLFPALIEATGSLNNAVPRLRGAAAGALSAFLSDSDYVDSELVQGSKELLMGTLFTTLQELPPSFSVSQGIVLGCIGSVAQVLGEDFTHYYHQLTPHLKVLIRQAGEPSKRFLRDSALECLSVVCEAVGREVAGLDAGECINMLLQAQKAEEEAERAAGAKGGTEAGEKERSAILDSEETVVGAFARLAECLGADFAPYLPYVIPIYGAKAKKQIQVTFTQSDEQDGATAIAVDEAEMKQKVMGTRMLVALVNALGQEVPAFWPLIDHLADIFVQIGDCSLPQVRELCVIGISGLFLAALADTSDVTHAQRMMDVLIRFATARLGPAGERNIENLALLGECVEEATKNAYSSTKPDYTGWETESTKAAAATAGGSGAGAVPPGQPIPRACINPALMPAFFAALQHTFLKSVERRVQVAEEVKAMPDADEEDAAKLARALNTEDELMSHCTDALGFCIKMTGQACLPVLTAPGGIGGTVLSFLDRKADWDRQLRSAALCLGDDLVEHASPASHTILPVFIPHVLECCRSKHVTLRQPATYGIGILAQYGGEGFVPHLPAAVRELMAVASAPDAKVDDNIFATDNAVSSLIKVAKYRQGGGPSAGAGVVDTEGIMTAALAYLPFKADAIEGCLVHGWMVEALASMDPFWFGPGACRAHPFLAALGRALAAHKANVEANMQAAEEAEEEEEGAEDEEELIEKKHIAMLPAIAHGIKAGPYAAQFTALFASLSKKEKAAFTHYGFAV